MKDLKNTIIGKSHNQIEFILVIIPDLHILYFAKSIPINLFYSTNCYDKVKPNKTTKVEQHYTQAQEYNLTNNDIVLIGSFEMITKINTMGRGTKT